MLNRVLSICAILLLSASGAMAQMRPGAKAASRACKPDYQALLQRRRTRTEPYQGLHEGTHRGAFRAPQGSAVPGLAARVIRGSRRGIGGGDIFPHAASRY